ncbi:MAG: DUF2142 domain-containing protein [Anaerolineales bacterium]|nr:DUF2142 domain-containing protein [Anaerolineales bacterium]
MRAASLISTLRSEKNWLRGILLAGLVHGLLFVFIVPPWQHYDEPGHFEYAWLLANNPGFPAVGDYDQGMRREVAASMVEHGFFSGGLPLPNLLVQDSPVWIGISQVADPPLYYWLAALPLRLVRTTDITFQLYLGRLVSLLMFLVSLMAAYGCMTEITRPGHALRGLVPLSMALLPGYVDLMTAVNNDVGATVAMSLFLWAGLRLVQRGLTWQRVVAAVFLTGVCVFMKATAAPAVLLLGVALLLAALPQRTRRVAWGICLAVCVLALAVVLAGGGAGAWYPSLPESTARRMAVSDAGNLSPVGNWAMLLSREEGGTSSQVIQPLREEQVRALNGKTVTLGAWMWANQPLAGRTPELSDGDQSWSEVVAVDIEPAFYAITLTVPEEASRLLVKLNSPAGDGTGVPQLYYDGVVLVEGDWHTEEPPEYIDRQGDWVYWGGVEVENLARNGSFEQGGLRVKTKFDRFILDRGRFQPSLILTSLADLDGSAWYYQTAFENMQRSFWAKFGWGHVLLKGSNAYLILGLFTTIGAAGALFALWQHRQELPWHGLVWLTIAAVVVWGVALGRGIGSLTGEVFIPGARYAYPAIVPTILLLAGGWWKMLRWIRLPDWGRGLLYGGLFVALDVWAFVSIGRFYTVP